MLERPCRATQGAHAKGQSSLDLLGKEFVAMVPKLWVEPGLWQGTGQSVMLDLLGLLGPWEFGVRFHLGQTTAWVQAEE